MASFRNLFKSDRSSAYPSTRESAASTVSFTGSAHSSTSGANPTDTSTDHTNPGILSSLSSKRNRGGNASAPSSSHESTQPASPQRGSHVVIIERLQPSIVGFAHALAVLSWPQIACGSQSQTQTQTQTSAHTNAHSHPARSRALRHARRYGSDLAELCESLTTHSSGAPGKRGTQEGLNASLLAQEHMLRASQSFAEHLDVYLEMMKQTASHRKSYFKKIHDVFSADNPKQKQKAPEPKITIVDLELHRLLLSRCLVDILAAVILLLRPASNVETEMFSASANIQLDESHLPTEVPRPGEYIKEHDKLSRNPNDDIVLAEFRACAPEIRSATLKLIDFVNSKIVSLDQPLQSLMSSSDDSSDEPLTNSFVRTTETLWSALRDLAQVAPDFDDEDEPRLAGTTTPLLKSYISITKAISQAFGDKMEDVLKIYDIKDIKTPELTTKVLNLTRSPQKPHDREIVKETEEKTKPTHSKDMHEPNAGPVSVIHESESDLVHPEHGEKAETSIYRVESSEDISESVKKDEDHLGELAIMQIKSIRASQSLKRRSALLVSDLRPKRSSKALEEEKLQHFASNFAMDKIEISIPEDAVQDTDYWLEPATDRHIIYYVAKNTTGIQRSTNRPIFSATLNKLMERLTDYHSHDTDYENVFFSTYPTFASSSKILEKLKQRFNVPLPSNTEGNLLYNWQEEVQIPIQRTVLRCLKSWVSGYSYNISTSTSIEIELFVREVDKSQPEYKEFTSKISEEIRNRVFRSEKPYEVHESSWKRVLDASKNCRVALPNEQQLRMAFEFEVEELARQITLIDFQVYSSIKPFELLHITWSESNLQFRCPNIVLMTQRFNQISAWVAASVISGRTVKERVRLIAKFTKMAEHLHELNNFNGLFAVTSGLFCSAVHRLKYTSQVLNRSTKKTLHNLNQLMSWDSSFRNYRKILDRVNPPSVPYFYNLTSFFITGMFLTDLTFLEHGNPNYCDGLINFHKRELVFRVIEKATRFQAARYDIPLHQEIHIRLIDLPEPDEAQLYQESLLREPRNAKPEDIAFE